MSLTPTKLMHNNILHVNNDMVLRLYVTARCELNIVCSQEKDALHTLHGRILQVSNSTSLCNIAQLSHYVLATSFHKSGTTSINYPHLEISSNMIKPNTLS